MLEKLILAAAITFSLNFFLAVNYRQADSGLYLGQTETGTGTLNAVDRAATTETPLIASAVGQK